MNPFIKLEIQNQRLVSQNFVVSCKLAARKDDNTIDADEEKVLKQIQKATDRYIKELSRIQRVIK